VAGVVLVDKEAGCTSHDVVARCRRLFGQRRVGHAGTLDPDATGLLVVGVGQATRLLGHLVGLAKSYTAEIVLGAATATLDSGGEVVGRWNMDNVSLADVRRQAASLTGNILQVPPMVSALKVGGQRLHKLARQGIEVDRPARPVTVSRFDVGDAIYTDASGQRVVSVGVDCSSGTYVRTLADDLGRGLGGGAHLRSLRRTRVGAFTVEQARPVEQLTPADVLAPVAAVGHLPRLEVGPALAERVGHGARLDWDTVWRDASGSHPGLPSRPSSHPGLPSRPSSHPGLPSRPGSHPGPWAVVDHQGRLLGLYLAEGEGGLRAALVLSVPSEPMAPS